jgi:cellulose synthase/poly-beta-1,6-N-acetylglucosamine synthase-like glycosyltransferase
MKILLLYLLAFANLISIIHIGLYTVGANSYDIVHFKKKRDALRKRRISRTKKLPSVALVSVIIPAHNEARVIRRTLDSVIASSYPNLEIIVVNDGSSDKTAQIVRDYIKRVKKTPKLRVWSYFTADGYASSRKLRYVRAYRNKCRVKVISQRNQGKAAAMNNALKNHVKGQLIMCLDADSILHPQAIENSVRYFKDHHIIGVAANVRVIESKTILGKLQRFEHLIGYRSKKFYSLANCEFIVGGVASTYRKSVIKKVKFYDNDTMTEDIGLSLKIVAQKGNRKHQVVYAPDVVALTEGVQTFNDLLKQRYRWKMGNLQNLFKYRSLIGKYAPKQYSRALTMYRLPMALLSEVLLIIEPILLCYIIYLSITYQTFGILIGAYLTITLYTMSVFWPDEHLSVVEKLKMSLSGLWIYALFYIMDVVQIYAIFKSLRLYQNIIHREASLSTWISPRRAKQLPSS